MNAVAADTYIGHVFERTGVERFAELVRRLMQGPRGAGR